MVGGCGMWLWCGIVTNDPSAYFITQRQSHCRGRRQTKTILCHRPYHKTAKTRCRPFVALSEADEERQRNTFYGINRVLYRIHILNFSTI